MTNLEKLSDRIRLKYNAPNPYCDDAIKLYMEALKEFNNKRDRRHSVSIPEMNK